ncbi:AMP-binding protein [Flavobacterium beibuense]|uniref:Acyl-CoA synthetase (AMP-forming)/AMP-acid ligase II-like protein n=1 Tax=Flavobacterium beibuense TaxID=657326 RepID=A0A444W979_9FLAO|nr:AMP-binding protein [Flavobacterium beibuense]RYJ42414.1 Acyl-CoA synthetase (AMP-forming)/AMP-acid ligase II-like protein [Flavobacterium beibuense]
MSNPDYHFVHSGFKLNGFHLNEDDLCRTAYIYIKEGEPHEKAVGEFLLDWFDHRDFIEMQTSGTTGLPKMIRVEKQAMVNSALATGEFFDLDEGIKVLHCLPTQFVAGKMMLVRAFILGWDMDMIAPVSHPLERLDTVYDFSAMVPLQAQNSLMQLKQVKKLILGGAKVSQALSNQLKGMPTKIYETYGMTETITHIAAKPIGDEAFTVLPNVEISQDERHCLVIDPYIICDEPVVTNDVVEIVSDTQFIWLGRYDNVINSGGVKLYPEQIEEKLSEYINRRYFVKGMPDETLGEKLVLVIEGEPYALEDDVFKRLGKFEKPKEILFVPKFAETVSGKVIRDKSLQEV